MDDDDALVGLRDQAQNQIAGNAVALNPAPTTEATENGLGPMDGAHAVLDAVGAGLGAVKDRLPEGASRAEKVAKGVGGFAAEAPGRILSAAEVLAAKDKARAGAGVVGGEIGGIIGGMVPGAELLTVPVGGYLGNRLGTFVYDHRADIAQAPAKVGQWLQNAAGMFGHGFDNGLPLSATPMN